MEIIDRIGYEEKDNKRWDKEREEKKGKEKIGNDRNREWKPR